MNAKVITISGSMKFWEEIIRAGRMLSMDWNIVLIPFKDMDHEKMSKEKREMHIEIHNKRIDMSDELYVVNVNDYIGKSTTNEIVYAMKNSKSVSFMEPTAQWKNILNSIEDSMIIPSIYKTLRMMIEELLIHIIKHASLLQNGNDYNFITSVAEIYPKQKAVLNLIEAVMERLANSDIDIRKECDDIKEEAYKQVLSSISDKEEISITCSQLSIESLIYCTTSELVQFIMENINRMPIINDEKKGM